MLPLPSMRVHMRAFVHKIHPFFADQWTTVNTLLSSTPRMGKVTRTALGTKKSLVTVNRGPHVHKKSREQFYFRTCSSLVSLGLRSRRHLRFPHSHLVFPFAHMEEAGVELAKTVCYRTTLVAASTL